MVQAVMPISSRWEIFPLTACGTEDLLLEENRDYHEFLVKNQVDVHYVETPGGHEWRFWDRHIYEFLKWLPTAKKPGIYTL